MDKISLMSSTLTSPITNMRTYWPHVQLASKAIQNFRRSQHAYVEVRVGGEATLVVGGAEPLMFVACVP